MEASEETVETAVPPPMSGSSASAGSLSRSALTEFSPEAHSWIMVPDANPPPCAPLGVGVPGAEGTTTSAPVSPPNTSSTPASPTMLRETGDLINAGLAVSEILNAESEWPLPLSRAAGATSPPPPPLMCSSDASFEGSPPPPSPHAASPRPEARMLGALAFPPLEGSVHGEEAGWACGGRGGAYASGAADDAESDVCDDDFDPFVCWTHTQTWARPLALVAVLLASHAACLLLGVALGRAQSKDAALAADADLRASR